MRRALLAALLLVERPAAAQSRGSDVSCVDCHNAYPPGAFGIARAADRRRSSRRR